MRTATVAVIVAALFACVGVPAERASAQGRLTAGLVAHWDFTEGSGEVLHDRSGHGNDGAIKGAKWVKDGAATALEFDGIDDHVDCGTGASLDLREQASLAIWIRPEEAVRGGESGIAGKPFACYGFTMSGSRAYSYISAGGNNVSALVRFGVWNHIASTYDGKRFSVYVNGKLVKFRPLNAKINSGGKFWIARSDGELKWTHDAHFHGRIAEMRVYNRALTSEEVAHIAATTNVTDVLDLTVSTVPTRDKVIVETGKRGLGEKGRDADVILTLRPRGTRAGRPLLSRTINAFDAQGNAVVSLDTPGLRPGVYDIEAVAVSASGKKMGLPATVALEWPKVEQFPNGPAGARRLNNLVTELLNVPGPDNSGKEYSFVNPRNGWIFISNAGSPEVRLTSEASGRQQRIPLATRYKGVNEAMRELPAGRYAVSSAPAKKLIIRAVPEIIYAQYGANPIIKAFGPFAGPFEREHVFKHLNTLMAGGVSPDDPFKAEWKSRGGKWVIHCSAPKGTAEKPFTAADAYKYIAGTQGFTQAGLDGSIADEFGSSEPVCAVYAEAIRKLKASPQFKDKAYYAFGGNIFNGPEGCEMMTALVETGGMFSWERYLKEQPTEIEAWRFLNQALIKPIRQFRDKILGSLPHVIVCFGYFSAPNETLDTFPHVNYRTYLDMQFNLVATHPDFKGIGSVMTYLAGYSDEEIVRWGGLLFRHYAIEGNPGMLTADPFILTHLENGDFEAAGRGWTLSPAEAGAIRFGMSPGFSTLQGRWPSPVEGDTVIITRRSARRPNVFSQEIKDLEPGRLYSFEMCSGDFKDLSVKSRYAVSIKLDNVTLIPEKCFTEVFASCYSHVYGPYNRDNPAYMNYHWRVFRARGTTARLTVGDWADEKTPGGPIGRELMHNFIQVQPYVSD